MLIGTSERARMSRHPRALPDGFSFHRSEWMDGGKDPLWSPTVFLVEQPPDSILASHFHTQNQFQVVMAGSGKLGAHDVRHGSVHYAGAYTGYGPVVAGPQGLKLLHDPRGVRERCELHRQRARKDGSRAQASHAGAAARCLAG